MQGPGYMDQGLELYGPGEPGSTQAWVGTSHWPEDCWSHGDSSPHLWGRAEGEPELDPMQCATPVKIPRVRIVPCHRIRLGCYHTSRGINDGLNQGEGKKKQG